MKPRYATPAPELAPALARLLAPVLATVFATVLALPGTVHAQNVTIYGIVDTGVEFLDKVGASGDSLTRMPSQTGSIPSRIGFRGTEDLGNGLKAVFNLEQGFATDQGTTNQGSRAWGRYSFVGLTGGFGALTLGRQYTMLYWSLTEADVIGPNIYGMGSLDAYLAGARADNSIAYKGSFGPVTIGATYSFGRDTAAACAGETPDSRACREVSAMARYDTASWGVAAALDRLHGAPGAGAGLSDSSLTDDRTTLNGYFKFADAKIAVGLLHRKNEGAALSTSNFWYLGANYRVSNTIGLDGVYYRLKFKNSANEANMIALRATYSLSKRTALYVTGGHISNDGALALSVSGGTSAPASPMAGGSQNGVMVGVRHTF